MTTFCIGDRVVGDDAPCYVIAEIGNNHNGDPEKAIELIKAAAATGADAVKFQTFRAEDIHNPLLPADAYPGFDASDRFETWIDYVRTTELDYAAYDQLIDVADKAGVDFLSTPASMEALDFLVGKGVTALKVASMDLTNQPFLVRCAESGLPVILSTGMANIEEIDVAVADLGSAAFAVLHCVSNYPTDDTDVHLRNMPMLAERYPHAVIGFSSHVRGFLAEPLAVAMGASILEKHFTLDPEDSDLAEHHVSLGPKAFTEMVATIRRTEAMLGGRTRVLTPEEHENAIVARRSVVATRDIAVGEPLSEADFLLIRPGTGIAPRDAGAVIGKAAQRPISAFQPITWEDLA